ncbi:MAG: hypothetical protein ACFFDU_06280 [Candidatus Thorarchaeota archaeon]
MQVIEWWITILTNSFYVALGAILSLGILILHDFYKKRNTKNQIRTTIQAELEKAESTLSQILSNAREGSKVIQLKFDTPFYPNLPISTVAYESLILEIHKELSKKVLISIQETYIKIKHFNKVYFRRLEANTGLFVTVHVDPTKMLALQIRKTLEALK